MRPIRDAFNERNKASWLGKFGKAVDFERSKAARKRYFSFFLAGKRNGTRKK